MGKKATLALLSVLTVVLTIILAATTTLSANSVRIFSEGSFYSLYSGMIMPLLIIANVFCIIFWLIKKRWIVSFIPLLALIGSYNYYGSIYQLGEKQNEEALVTKENKNNIRVLTYNTHQFANGEIRNIGILSEFLAKQNIDIACFQEFSQGEKLKDTTIKIFQKYPYSLTRFNNPQMRIGLYSKYPIIESKYEQFPGSQYGYIKAIIATTPKIMVIATHLQSTGVSSTIAESSRAHQAGMDMDNMDKVERTSFRMFESAKMREVQISVLSGIIKNSEYPVILCGDFNDLPMSYTYNIASNNLIDGFKEGGNGYIYTYKQFKNLLRIDYIFHSKEFKSVKYYSPDKQFSDHNPVISELETL